MCVALQFAPGLMLRELSHLRDGVPAFEQSARCLVPQIVQDLVLDTEHLARPREGGPNALRFIGENELAVLWLALDDLPRLGRMLEAPVTTHLPRGMLRIANETRPRLRIIVLSAQAADFGFPVARMDGKPRQAIYFSRCNTEVAYCEARAIQRARPSERKQPPVNLSKPESWKSCRRLAE
jgi:hypothetical protein